MNPYVVKQGDFLLQLAYEFGFDADGVWNDPSNDEIRKARSEPNILFPGDLLHIPQANKPPVHSLETGQTNSFVAPAAPTVTITQKFVDPDKDSYVSKAFTVQELDQLTGLSTDEDGTATFPAPLTLDVATIVFTESGETWKLLIGHMDPIETRSGIFKRLQNLGYIGSNRAVRWGFGSRRSRRAARRAARAPRGAIAGGAEQRRHEPCRFDARLGRRWVRRR